VVVEYEEKTPRYLTWNQSIDAAIVGPVLTAAPQQYSGSATPSYG